MKQDILMIQNLVGLKYETCANIKLALDFLSLEVSASNIKHAVALLKHRKIWS